MAKKKKKIVETIETAKIGSFFKKDKKSSSIDDLKKNLKKDNSDEDEDSLSYLKDNLKKKDESKSYLDKLKSNLKNPFKKKEVEEEYVVEEKPEPKIVAIKADLKNVKQVVSTKGGNKPKPKSKVKKKTTKKVEPEVEVEVKVVVKVEPSKAKPKPKKKKEPKVSKTEPKVVNIKIPTKEFLEEEIAKLDNNLEDLKKIESKGELLTSKKIVTDKPLNAVKKIDDDIQIIKDVSAKPVESKKVVKKPEPKKVVDSKKATDFFPVEFQQDLQKHQSKVEKMNTGVKVVIDKALTNYERYKEITSIPFKIKVYGIIVFDSLKDVNKTVHFRLNMVSIHGQNFPYAKLVVQNHD